MNNIFKQPSTYTGLALAAGVGMNVYGFSLQEIFTVVGGLVSLVKIFINRD